jgi:hypothetical protein
MRITALVPTHHLPEESMAWMTEARNIFDDVIVLIDQKRATLGTVARAEKVATKVVRNNRDNWYEPDRFSLLAGCESDWVIILEYDEQLSPEWHQDGWRQLLETTHFTHFWIPRRWTVPNGRYISANPWWPDFQLRLFRNHLEGTTFATRLHDSIRVPGPGAGFRSLMIHHHVLALCSRTEREKKVRDYEQLRPGHGSGHYYLYENYRPAEAPLPESGTLDLDREVIRMDALPAEKISRMSIKLESVVQEVTVSEMFWLDVEVTNVTNEPIYSCPPFPVRLSYHWIQETTHLIVVFDGERSGLFPCAPANSTTSCKMVVIAPSEPGDYVLQISIIQDGIRWFEEINPDILKEFAMRVIP